MHELAVVDVDVRTAGGTVVRITERDQVPGESPTPLAPSEIRVLAMAVRHGTLLPQSTLDAVVETKRELGGVIVAARALQTTGASSTEATATRSQTKAPAPATHGRELRSL